MDIFYPSGLTIDNLSSSSLKMDNLCDLSKLLQSIKEYITRIMKDAQTKYIDTTQTKYIDTTQTISIKEMLVEIYLELYKKYLLCNIIDDIYQFACDQKQEKTIDYEQKIESIYNSYLDKFKKNTKISEVESKLLSSYRDKIDGIKYNIPRAKQEDSLNFFYSVYALNELFGCYIDDYLELAKYLRFDEDLVKLGKNFYIENKKFDVL
ncbi:TPA: hypothetical protein R1696_000104 [Campylobacter coli]|nr:hypothetical protein [Campylobacter coli]HEC1740743.1 hypothetical protein [Campylobacter coli]